MEKFLRSKALSYTIFTDEVNMISIAIVDSQIEYGKKLHDILSRQKDFRIAGQGKDGYDALKIAGDFKPDIMFLDIDLPDTDAIALIPLLKSRFPSMPLIICSGFHDDEIGDEFHIDHRIIAAFSLGVSGCVTRRTLPEFLRQSVRTVYYGGSVICPEIAAKTSRLFSNATQDRPAASAVPLLPKLPGGISIKQLQVMGRIGRGLTNREIARELELKEGTVRNYVSTVLQKTGLKHRAQIVVFSLTHGL